MSDKIVELRNETNDNEGKKIELKEENDQLEEGNEASKTGNSQLFGNFRAQFRRCDTNEIIPIASTPAPHYIDGFRSISLNFVNERIMDFFKNIDRLLQNCDLGVSFHFNSRAMHKDVTSMHALLEYLANKIMCFGIWYHGWRQKPYLNDFNRQFPGILDQIQFLCFHSFLHIGDFDTTLKWMTKQSNDGKQKIIKFGYDVIRNYTLFINRIKQQFINSNSASIFFIYFAIFNQNFEEFTLENAQTNEILTIYRRDDWDSYYIMARYPKGEEHWKEDGLMKIEKARSSNSIIYIDA